MFSKLCSGKTFFGPDNSKWLHSKQLGNYLNNGNVQMDDNEMRCRQLLGLLSLTFALTGCQLIGQASSIMDTSIAKLSSQVGLGPNSVESVGVMAGYGGTPAAAVVEIAFAYGDAAMAVLSQANVTTWYTERAGYCRSYSNQLDVLRLEVPMGYSALVAELPADHATAQAIFIFVKGVGKADVTTMKTPWVSIVEGELTILEAPPGSMQSSNGIVAENGVKPLC